MIKKIFIYSTYILKLIFAYVIGTVLYVFNKNYREVWLISERGKDARDNGYHLFKYINQNHPEVKSYYVINYKCSDYRKVAKIGNTVNYRSLKHYVLFAISRIKISTHIMGFSPDINHFNKIDRLGLISGKRVFLQHGIIYNDLPYLYYPNAKLDLFVCGAYPEYQYVNKKFKHKEGVVQYLGLCRYDELSASGDTLKQVLLMPTWRNYIKMCNNSEEFMETEYFEVFQSLINNKDLSKILKEYGYNLIFYPHFEVQKYLSSFSTSDDTVIIASFENYDVQTLLKESSVLITDFSSVFFDFAYMKKAALFYQFDEQGFKQYHYAEGYFNYRDDGFGSVVTEESYLLDELKTILKNGATIENKYLDKIESFFTIYDNNNCKRNFEAIKKL